MRKLIRNLFWITIVLMIVFTYFDPLSYLKLFQFTNKEERNIGKPMESKPTYLISQDNWLTFEIPTYAKKLKFLSTANLIPDIENMKDLKNIRYSLEYEFYNKNNKLINSNTYHFKTAYVQFQDDNNTLVRKSCYLDVPLRPNVSQTFFISLKNSLDATKVRIKIKSKDFRIVDVGLQSYFLEETPEDRRDIIWERMSQKKKKHLSLGNIYTTSYMSEDEKRNLVSSLWRPNGPIGVEGEDYQIRRLYGLTELENISPCIDVQPDFYADENITATRYIKQGRYDIVLKPMTEYNSSVVLKYYVGKLPVDIKRYTLDNKDKTVFFESSEDGLLEINSSKGIAIHVKDNLTQESLDLPPIISSDYYKLDDNHTIDYNFFSSKKRFIRVECRSSHIQSALLTMILKDKNNKNIKTIHKAMEFIPSRYDYIKSFVPQSKPYFIYLEIPSAVSSIRLSSDQEISLRLATRGESMVYPIYSSAQENKSCFDKLSSWFTIRPLNFNQLPYKDMKITLYKQPATPVVNPLIEQGKFEYEQLFPYERWRGHTLLLKRPLDDNYIRSQSWKSIYTKVSSTKKTQLSFKDDIGLKETVPTLLYHHTQEQPIPVSIYLDGELVEHKILKSPSGSMTLPITSLKTSHTLEFGQSKNIDYYISNTSHKSDVYYKRNFISFDAPVKFKIKKCYPEESIGFQLAAEGEGPSTVLPFNVNLDFNTSTAIEAYQSYTFKKYRLEAEISNQKVMHITNHNKPLSVAEPMYLNLGENLPVGEYTMTVYPPDNSSTNYLFVNHLILNKNAKIRMSKEVL